MATLKPRYWTTDRIMQLIIGVVISVLLVLLVRYLSDVLLPFFAACFIAYLLQPLVRMNQRLLRCKGRALPAVVTLLDILALTGLVVYLFMPPVLSELNELNKILTGIGDGRLALPPVYRDFIEFVNKYFDPAYIRSYLSGDRLMSIINRGSSILVESWDIILTVCSWLLTIIYVLFILIDYPAISRGFKLIVPGKYRARFLSVFADVSANMNRYFRGQGFVALCAMVFYCIGFSIVGLPLAIPLGLLVGLLYMIPYFQYVTLIPVAAICFIYSLGGNAGFLPLFGKSLLVYVVSQCVCDYIITPHVMGREMGLNAAVILLALSVWGSLLGIIGMIIALPVTSLIMTYYARYISGAGSEVANKE